MAEEKKVKYDFGKKCVCVGRVSTSIQSQTAQIRDLEEFAKSWGFEDIKTFFTTESGFLEFDEKQGWNLVSDFFDNNPDYRVLICPEISRLSRKEHILHKIKDYLIENKIQLIIKDINYILFNEWGEIPKGNEIIFALYASLADSEMRQKKERFARSLKDNRQLGYSIGGKVLFGYERYYELKDGKNRSKYRINEKEAEEVRTLYRWYAFGVDGDMQKSTLVSLTKECIERGFSKYLHSRRNVNKCLKEQAYCGLKETHNRVKNPDYWNYHKYDEPKYVAAKSYVCAYPPILTGDDAVLFEIVQKRLKQNNSKYTRQGDNIIDKSSKHTNILAKLLVCPECGTFLNADYRRGTHSQRPHLGNRDMFSYRCGYSRGVVHICPFKRSVSMPMMDSVVWSYCKAAAYQLIRTETNQDVKERISEIQSKVDNLTTKIQDYDIDGRIKSEDAILRAKTRVLKDALQIDEAVKEYEEHIEGIQKELNDYKARKLELEQEIEAIKKGASFLDAINQSKGVSSNKKQLYKYIHKIVQKVEFFAWDRYHLVIQVHFKKAFPFYKKNEYICIYSKTTKNTTALLVHSYDVSLERAATQALNKAELGTTDATEQAFKKLFLDSLPSTDSLRWDKDENKFKVGGFAFTLDELKDFYDYPLLTINPLNPRLGATVVGAPVHIRKLEVERLNCYAEDRRDLSD